MRNVLVTVMITTVVLAGCAATDEPAPSRPQQAAPTPSTGSLRGVVVDEAIRPLEGVRVALLGTTHATTTAADGAFAMLGLAPGTYDLEANQSGRETVRTRVVVMGGGEATAVQVVLPAAVAPGPIVEAISTNGLIGFSMTLGSTATPPLSTSFPLPTESERDVSQRWEVPLGPPDWAQTELFWDAATPLASTLLVFYTVCDVSCITASEVQGPSPLLLTATGRQLIDADASPDRPVDTVAAAHWDQFGQPAGVGLAINQDIQFVTHLFWGGLPPEGWRWSVDGEPFP